MASAINGSSTARVEVLTVVVSPLTVKLPAIVTSSGNPIVILLFETVVFTSLEVPSKVKVSLPTVTVSFDPLSAAIVSVELVEAVLAAVIRP